MNFDYLEISRSLDKDKPCLDYLDWQLSTKYGLNKFTYEGCKDVEIWLNEASSSISIKGSISYFMAGQNFKTSSSDLKNGISYLGSILEINLFDAEVKAFEYGSILSIPFSPEYVFNSHVKIQGMKSRSFDYGKYFEDRIMKVKLYDAGRNLKIKLSKNEREKLADLGYDSKANYLKIENHYKKPSIAFKKRLIQTSDLLTTQFQQNCKSDLMNKYASIQKTKGLKVTDKKNLSCSTIPLLILKEYESFLPCKADMLLKQKIKSIPEAILNKNDKKSRIRQIRNNLRKIESEGKCKYDVSEILESELKKIDES